MSTSEKVTKFDNLIRSLNKIIFGEGDVVLDGSTKPTIDKFLKSIAANGWYEEPFPTESALLQSVPTKSRAVAKALDTKKVFYWNGLSWVDTGLSELDLAKADATTKSNAAENNAKQFTTQYFVNLGLYSGKIPAEYDQNGIVLRYFDENANLIVSNDVYAKGLKLAGLPDGVVFIDSNTPAHIASDDIMPLSFDKYGRLIAIPHPSFAKQVTALAGISVDLSSFVSSDDIVLYGDSLTAPGSGYGDLLSLELGGRSVANRGSGGQDTLNIVQRQGGAPITVAAFTMPASGSVTVTLTNGDPFYSKGGTYIAKINDIAVAVAPTATQNQWTMTRTNAGEAISVGEGSIIILDEQESFRNKTLILQPGPNFGAPTTAPTRQQMRPYLELTANAIAHLKPKIKKFLVIGDYTPAVSSKDKSKLRDHVVLFNQMLKELVGEAHFIDWHSYGSKQAIYDGVALGLISSVTAQDIGDMDAGFVPNSLTSDGIHANAAFKTLQAKFIAMHIKAKGL